MDTLETRNFIDKVKKGISKEYITELVDTYLLSDRPANTLNAFDNIVADSSLASYPDRRMCEKILERLLNQHVAAGGDPKSFSDSITSNPLRISFNANEIKKSGEKDERTNKFSIAVSGTNLFAVLNEILSLADEAGYPYDIDIPIMRELDQGVIETINLYCSSKKIGDTINFINSFSDELKAKFAPNNSKAMLYTPSISYDSFSAETGKWGKTIVGESLVAAIDNVISNAVERATIQVSVDDANYFNNEHDMTASYLFMREKFAPAKLDFYQLVSDYLKETLKSMEIDPNNIYMPKAFIKNLYLVNHATSQVVSPTGFVANQVIQAKPAAVSFEQNEEQIQNDSHILGADDIPDLPEGVVSMGVQGGQNNTPQDPFLSPEPKNDTQTKVEQTGLIKGPEMMLVPEMLERHHNDTDIEGLYQTFIKIKNDETKISAKILQLNQVWPDLTYADLVAFRQYDKTGEFIPDGFIQLWVDTKQNGTTPTISSEELYKTQSNGTPVEEQAPGVAPAPVETGAPAPAPIPSAPLPEKKEGEQPQKVVATRRAPANARTSKTARVIQLISRGPQPVQGEQVVAGQGVENPPQQLPVPLEGTDQQGTGMYSDTPVEVQPLENQQLTQGEAQAMMQVGNNTLTGVDLQKYAFFPNPEITLAQPVVDLDGSTITLYAYLEKYNVLGAIPRDVTVTTPDAVTTADDFIVNNLSLYVVTNGAVAVEEYLELLNASINAKEEKKGIIGKFFKKS